MLTPTERSWALGASAGVKLSGLTADDEYTEAFG